MRESRRRGGKLLGEESQDATREGDGQTNGTTDGAPHSANCDVRFVIFKIGFSEFLCVPLLNDDD